MIVDPQQTRRALRNGEMTDEFAAQLRAAGGDVLAEVFAFLLGKPSKTLILARAVESYRGLHARGQPKEDALEKTVEIFADRLDAMAVARACKKPNGHVNEAMRRLRRFTANLD